MTSAPDLPPQTLHLPFAPGPHRMAMALQPCPLPAWIEIDSRYPAEMAERRALLAARHAEVFAALPASAPARAETLALLASHLAAHHPAWFRRDGRHLHNALTGETWDLAAPPLDPLEVAGRLVQEDLCLIRPDAAGRPVLEAAVLCAPPAGASPRRSAVRCWPCTPRCRSMRSGSARRSIGSWARSGPAAWRCG